MHALTDLENQFDGPIPPHILAARTFGGSRNEFELTQAKMFAAGMKGWILGSTGRSRDGRGQIAIIRARRADGSFYPALVDDLHCYLRSWCAAMVRVRALQAVVNSERRAGEALAVAAE